MSRQLYRSKGNKVLAGVCSGIAEYFDIDPTIVRVIWFLSIFAGIGIIAYIVCWVIIPERNSISESAVSHTSEQEPGVDKDKSKRILGIALIIIGAVFLLDKSFKWLSMDIIIPVGVIAAGAYILLNKRG